MNIAIIIVQLLVIFILPYILMKVREKKAVKLLGTIGTAYFIGIVLSLLLFLLRRLNVNINLNTDVSEISSYLSISVAIPLLLFSTNLKTVKKLSKKALGSFALLTVSVLFVSVIVGISMKKVLPRSTDLAGMAIGLYTGGTPNLNAIGTILGVDSQTIALSNLSDMLIGGVFYVFLLVACKPLLSKILKAKSGDYYTCDTQGVENIDNLESKDIKVKPLIISVLAALGIAVIGAGIGILIWYLLGAKDGTMFDYLVPSIMLTATILGIVGSASRRLRETKGNNMVGHYLILVFSLALSMSMRFEDMSVSALHIFVLFAAITVGAFLVHLILCKIFKIDVDCAMVTLTAGIYGPAFIPAITKQIKNENLTAVGLICGSLGYAIGTFLGVGLAFLMRL